MAYTDKDTTVPIAWVESDAKLINNPQMVKLHSFDTKVLYHFVTYHTQSGSVVKFYLFEEKNGKFCLDWDLISYRHELSNCFKFLNKITNKWKIECDLLNQHILVHLSVFFWINCCRYIKLIRLSPTRMTNGKKKSRCFVKLDTLSQLIAILFSSIGALTNTYQQILVAL